jgi:hypothetical protein
LRHHHTGSAVIRVVHFRHGACKEPKYKFRPTRENLMSHFGGNKII